MPIGVGGAALITAGAQVLGGATNQWIQAGKNKAARRWQERETNKQYDRDIDQRDYANWYNSPEQQMARFEEAGLNPHLIYGKGTPGQQTSNPQATKSPGQFTHTKFETPDVNILGQLGQYASLKKLNKETDLVSETIHAQQLKNRITEGTLQTQIDYEIERLNNLKKRSSNEVERGLLTQQIRKLTIEKTAYERERSKLLQSGISTGDNILFRMGYQGLQKFGQNITDIKAKINPKLNWKNAFNFN